MKSELQKNEIKKCRELLKDPTLGNSQRFNLESYLRSLEMDD